MCLLAEPLCIVNPFPQHNKWCVIFILQWRGLTITYAITLTNTAGQICEWITKNIKLWLISLGIKTLPDEELTRLSRPGAHRRHTSLTLGKHNPQHQLAMLRGDLSGQKPTIEFKLVVFLVQNTPTKIIINKHKMSVIIFRNQNIKILKPIHLWYQLSLYVLPHVLFRDLSTNDDPSLITTTCLSRISLFSSLLTEIRTAMI